jgi:hypothetical protein
LIPISHCDRCISYFISSDIHHPCIHYYYTVSPSIYNVSRDRLVLLGWTLTQSVRERLAKMTPARQPPPQLPCYTDPDIPPCDACGKEFSGNLICNSCQSAFYCSKDCQKNAWKHGGHKQSCNDMKEQCVREAKRVVQALTKDQLRIVQQLRLMMEISWSAWTVPVPIRR